MEEEIWKDIDGTDGFYQVSNLGQVRSFNTHGQHKKWNNNPKVLALIDRGNGYWHVNIYRTDRVILTPVHRLVLETFIGPCPEGYEACHNNSNPKDNRLENLRWDTRSSNFLDKRANGTARLGEANNKTKFTTEQVLEIRARYPFVKNFNQLAREYGVADITIARIVKRKVWTHI